MVGWMGLGEGAGGSVGVQVDAALALDQRDDEAGIGEQVGAAMQLLGHREAARVAGRGEIQRLAVAHHGAAVSQILDYQVFTIL